MVVPLHAITTSNKNFQCGKNQHKGFEEIKQKNIQAPIISLPNLYKYFEADMDPSGYVVGVVLMQGGRSICYNSRMFLGGILNYRTYDKELYTLVEVVKKWKQYLMGKDIIIHMNHQPLHYLQS